ncbi:hypothetical protein ENUP19_0181G0010 [Entamoeba nuttalli]|uniref:YhhN family protein n=2 Tax=Entamoeba nuttalli TaxID=412467 RepID=K2G990_ENTNP|nr:YhhN family protein [Entamoeba nuttalli P19]EKE39031.1 YhhN family protein [Entamoeba nuttalli P19]|eukprot:XP_008858635.1 YhhN family protein [Entamoeba nuttalli P19]
MIQSISLLLITIINALICWYSYFNKLPTLKFISKPPFCIFLSLFTYNVLGISSWHFILGLVLSFLGDFFLLFTEHILFLIGAFSFLFAHVFYSIGFNTTLSSDAQINYLCYIVVVLPILGALTIYHLAHKEQKGTLVYGCFLYMSFVAIGMFNCFRTLTDPSWNLLSSLICCGSYFIFFISDLLVSFNEIVKTTWLVSLLIIVTYHIAQIGIICGLVLNMKYDHLIALLN